MALRLGYWEKEGREPRVYINGIEGLGKFDKIWTDKDRWPDIYTLGNVRTVAVEEARRFLSQWVSWEACVQAARGIIAPDGNGEFFQRAHIAHVAAAARMAGVAFRNGLTKDEIISRILQGGSVTIETARTYVTQLQAGKTPDAPKAPTPAPDWITDWEDWKPPVPAPAPMVQPPVTPMPVGEYVTRTELHGCIKPINATLEALETGARTTDETLQGLRAKVAELQAMQPIAVHFPENPAPIVINGLRHPLYLEVLRALRARINVALIGGAGSGKTTATEQLARDLGLRYFKEKPFADQFEILGHRDGMGVFHETPTYQAAKHGGLICYDEADRSNPDALIALNAVLDTSRFIAFANGELVEKHPDFVAVWCGNTDGSGATMSYASAQRQDGSTLDRVAMFDWEVDPRVETTLAQGQTVWQSAVLAIRRFVAQKGILDVVGTPRATKHGATLLLSGMAPNIVLAVTCKRGALRECWREVEALPAVAAFLRG